MKTEEMNLTNRLLEIIRHIGANGASSENFLIERLKISKSSLANLEKSGYLKREQTDVRHKSESVYSLKSKSKSILGKGNYMKGSPTRTELPTLLYMEEVVQTFREEQEIIAYQTERQIKGLKARQANTKNPQELIGLLHEEAPDGRIVYRRSAGEAMQFLNIEIDGAYHGKELSNKLTALESEEHKTLWICTKKSRVAHVQKYAQMHRTQNIDIIYIGDLHQWTLTNS